METTVCKRYKFSAAHFLPEHDSLCRNTHGHTFWADVYARGEIKRSGSEIGMVVEYDRLTKAWNDIADSLDHALLNDLMEYPTTELVATYILSSFVQRVPEVFKVRLWEGPGQFAEVEL